MVNRSPAWSTDGSYLSFSRSRFDNLGKPNEMSQIMVARRRNSKFARPVAVGQKMYSVLSASWRPEHDEIAYIKWSMGDVPDFRERHRQSRRNVVLLDVRRNYARALTSYAPDTWVDAIAWSPDGRRLAMVTEVGSSKRLRSLDVIDLDRNERRSVLRKHDLPTAHGYDSIGQIRWSPDGRSIVLEVSHLNRGDLARLDWKTGKLTWLTNDGQSHLPIWWGGSRIVFTRNYREIWLTSSVGTHARRLYSLPR